MAHEGQFAARSCGSIRGAANGLGFLAGSAYIVGPIVATARHVEITFGNGDVIDTTTIPAPLHLVRTIAFYATEKPCTAMPISIIARDRTGRIVASWTRTSAALTLPGRLAC